MMAAWRFDWADLVTPALLESLRVAAGVQATADLGGLDADLACCLAAAGGVPIWPGESAPDEAACTAHAQRLLAEVLSHAACGQLRRPRPDGLVLDAAPGTPLAQRARALPLLEVNLADAADFDALPGIGPALAQRIVHERRAHGAYRSRDELAARVPGLGAGKLEPLRTLLSFALPSQLRMNAELSADWRDNLRALMALMPGSSAAQHLVALCRHLADASSGEPAPDTGAMRLRTPTPAPVATAHDAAWISVLAGSEYHARLPGLIAAATQRIAMAMFHVAMPGAEHPTHELIDALIAAQARGVQVQVLLDRDRASDPYRSTVINRRAALHLAAGGVAVREDSAERLLHSKFLLFDDHTVVLGSHNWSAGSYFGFDDVSLAVHAPPLAAQLRERFDALFATGTPP